MEKMEEDERKKEEELEKKHGKKYKKKKKKKKDDGPMETVILEQTIVKIGALLALGFGEAGSKIIATNMENSGDVDPMIPGVKCISIFGFCDIRNFTDSTEQLQEGVMLFVNEIGELVHSVCDHYSGAANKNVGDAFLLVWRFEEEEDFTVNEETEDLTIKDSRKVRQIADMTIVCFTKIITEIRRSKKLRKYRDYGPLLERMPNYEVKMGFGLHVGWAIEGAIGSFYKIDASYLSPNVELTIKLEGATKAFGVPILLSGELKAICSKEADSLMRHVDSVKFVSNGVTCHIYTIDLDPNTIDTDFGQVSHTRKQAKLRRVKAKLNRQRYRD